MPSSPLSLLAQQLCAAAEWDGAGLTDGDLLTRFLSQRDDDALAALMRRHAPMVWGVCRRLLRNTHDAEDAFQATFLVLVRKAVTVDPREMVGNWLYGVARQTAVRLRATVTKRDVREVQMEAIPEPVVVEARDDELLSLLDEELSRLPERSRVLIVLCDLEGKSRKDVAQQLGYREGTVASGLARARELLAKRMARRGLAVSGGSLAAILSHSVASAGVPPTLLNSTIEVATSLATGPAVGAISGRVAALTEGVLKTMFLNKLKIATAVLFVLTIVAAGVTLPLLAGQPQPPATDKPAAREAVGPKEEAKPLVVKEDNQFVRVAWSADGKTVATVGIRWERPDQEELIWHSTIKFWDPKTGKLTRSLGEDDRTSITALAFSSDNKTAAYLAEPIVEKPDTPKEVRIVDAQTGKLKQSVAAGGTSLLSLAFSPDGNRLAFGGMHLFSEEAGFFIQLWDVQKEKKIGGTKVKEVNDGVERIVSMPYAYCLAFSPDGKVLAVGAGQGKIRLFDGRTGEPRGELEHGEAPVMSVAFAGADRLVSVGGISPCRNEKPLSGAGAVKLWDLKTEKVLRTLDSKGSALTVAVSSDGSRLATGGFRKEKDRLIREVILWDAKTGEAKQTFSDLPVGVRSLAFSPDDKTLAAAGGTDLDLKNKEGKTTGELRLFRLSP